jgi:hypothetical protein
MGMLVPPKRYRQDPNTFVMTGLYGRLFGGEGFPCTIYSQHEPRITGAACAQACVIMSMGMLTDRGAVMNGSYSVTYLAAKQPMSELPPANDPDGDCIAFRRAATLSGWFDVGGLSLPQLMGYFNRYGNVGAFLHQLRYEDRSRPLTERVITRLIEAYVLARFPVILAVDTDAWVNESNAPSPREHCSKHAAVVVGIRRSNLNPDEVALIVHDPASQPFLELAARSCIRASQYFAGSEIECDEAKKHDVHLLAVTDARIRRDVWRCMRAVAGHRRFGPILEKYERPKVGDLRVRLLWRDDLADGLLPIGQRAEHRVSLHDQFCRLLDPSRYWAIACYDDDDDLQHAWLFDANQPDRGRRVPGFYLDFAAVSGPRSILLQAPDDVVEHIRRSLHHVQKPSPRATEPQSHSSVLLTQRNSERLQRSVITSCSIRSLPDFLDDVRRVDGVDRCDLLMLRDTDIDDLSQHLGRVRNALYVGSPNQERPLNADDRPSSAEILACGRNVSAISDWLIKTLQKSSMKVAAFATYLPHITSLTPDWAGTDRRKLAKDALVHIVKIARTLREKDCLQDSTQPAIIEIVCGTRLDPCRCRRCVVESAETANGDTRGLRIFESYKESKVRELLLSLRSVVGSLRELDAEPVRDFVFGLELEPGPTYILNSVPALKEVKRQLDAEFQDLKPYVGFNLDLAHMRIADIHASEILDLGPMFVHAHIADHPPFMHTRDQVPGDWTPIQYGDHDGYLPYLRLLDHSGEERQNNKASLPFSNAVALELEGCNRIAWTHKGLNALKQLLRAV